MNDAELSRPPSVLGAIGEDTRALGFTMASEPKTGAMLAALAASKPGGRLLELGTGTGVGTAWLLCGMDSGALLDTVDDDRTTQAVAQRHLGTDARVSFHAENAATFIARAAAATYDLVYADAWPGKFTHLPETLALLRPGGIYVIDDLLPHPDWPGDHPAKVSALIELLEAQPGCRTVRLSWASGLLLLVRAGLPRSGART